MKRNVQRAVCWSLIGVNVLMASVLTFQHFRLPRAAAENGRPSDYMVVPGNISAAVNGVVYILDTNNSQLSAMTYDSASKSLTTMPKIDLKPVFSQAAPPVPPKKR